MWLKYNIIFNSKRICLLTPIFIFLDFTTVDAIVSLEIALQLLQGK